MAIVDGSFRRLELPDSGSVVPHYVRDQWTDSWRQNAHGDVIIVRYADGAVRGFQHQYEAEKFLRE